MQLGNFRYRGAVMSKEIEIVITGFGGQGIVLTGNILGRAATLYDHQHATMTQSYGPEARGGSCSAQVVIGQEEILFPYAEKPQVLICLSQAGYDKNQASLIPDGLLIYDTDLVDPGPSASRNAFHLPATRYAEQIGNKMMANIVLLGFLSAVSEMVTPESLKTAVLESVPPRTRDKNAQAFDRGREYGQAILRSRSKQNQGQTTA
ncbi:MAG: 2-oxoacid:acceptor oxidoreductase family protein [Deltaproteobacteria bacterium]|nr:2-oxoacid:acceptor oxidoreductase family protein [Deltaproteobacteria bacterium]